MDIKVNLVVDGREMTVYFDIVNGPKAPCYYCAEQGIEQLILIEKIVEENTGTLSPRTKLFKQAQATVTGVLLHKRAVCSFGTECGDKYQDELDKRIEDVGGEW